MIFLCKKLVKSPRPQIFEPDSGPNYCRGKLNEGLNRQGIHASHWAGMGVKKDSVLHRKLKLILETACALESESDPERRKEVLYERDVALRFIDCITGTDAQYGSENNGNPGHSLGKSSQ